MELPYYHLSSITRLDDDSNDKLDKKDIDINIDIDLKEKETIIYQKIVQFLKYVIKKKNNLPDKEDCIIF